MENHNLKILIEQSGTHVDVKIIFDGVPFKEHHNFCDKEHADGLIMDIFNELTGNRYNTPSKFISPENLFQQHL